MNTPRKKTWLINCTEEEDCTKQSFKDECDMNNIVARINKSGFIPLEAQDSLRRQVYADVSGAPQSLEEAYAIVERADEAFSTLPARLRERFGGPAGLLSFLDDPENLKEAQDLGLVAKTPPTPISGPKTAASTPSVNGEAAASQQSAPAAASVQEPAK